MATNITMSRLDQKLSEALDIEPVDFSTTEIVDVTNVIDDDAEFARKNLRNLIEKGSIAADNILHVAKESEHPRAYEVIATLIKSVSEANKDLLELQKRKKDLIQDTTPQNVTNNLFIGSTAELQKLIKNNGEK